MAGDVSRLHLVCTVNMVWSHVRFVFGTLPASLILGAMRMYLCHGQTLPTCVHTLTQHFTREYYYYIHINKVYGPKLTISFVNDRRVRMSVYRCSLFFYSYFQVQLCCSPG